MLIFKSASANKNILKIYHPFLLYMLVPSFLLVLTVSALNSSLPVAVCFLCYSKMCVREQQTATEFQSTNSGCLKPATPELSAFFSLLWPRNYTLSSCVIHNLTKGEKVKQDLCRQQTELGDSLISRAGMVTWWVVTNVILLYTKNWIIYCIYVSSQGSACMH